MPQGKKTPPDVIYKIMASWAITNNYSQTARELNIPKRTVSKIVRENQTKPEFAKLCAETRTDFSQRAGKIIDLALTRLENDINDPDKIIPVNHLTTVIGTLFDKRALSQGQPTHNVGIIGDDDIAKLAEIAGYEKRK